MTRSSRPTSSRLVSTPVTTGRAAGMSARVMAGLRDGWLLNVIRTPAGARTTAESSDEVGSSSLMRAGRQLPAASNAPATGRPSTSSPRKSTSPKRAPSCPGSRTSPTEASRQPRAHCGASASSTSLPNVSGPNATGLSTPSRSATCATTPTYGEPRLSRPSTVIASEVPFSWRLAAVGGRSRWASASTGTALHSGRHADTAASRVLSSASSAWLVPNAGTWTAAARSRPSGSAACTPRIRAATVVVSTR